LLIKKQCCFPKTNDQNVKIIDDEEEEHQTINKDKQEEKINIKQDETRNDKEESKNIENKNIKFNSFSSFSKLDKVEKVEEKKVKLDEIEQFIGTGRYVTDDEIKNAPTMTLEEITDKNILRGSKLTINAAGLVGGNRKARDGVAFFGRQLKKV
jgi:hypothetical protein